MTERTAGRKEGVPPEWQIFERWRREVPLEQRLRGVLRGDWPEGTPPEAIAIATKTTPAERVTAAVSGDYPTLEEIQARSAEDVQRAQAATRLEGTSSAVRAEMDAALARLSERERVVLTARFGMEDGVCKTQAEVGQLINRSPRTIGRIEKRALRKLQLRLSSS